MTTPGIHRNLPAGLYHADPAISASRLKLVHDGSPAHLKRELDEPREVTWEMIFGTLVHSVVLEPNAPLPSIATFPETYVVPDDVKPAKGGPSPGDTVPWNNRTNYCKAWRAAKEAEGFIVCPRESLDEVFIAADVIKANRHVMRYLDGSQQELSMFWQTARGNRIKARMDFKPALPVLGDIKTTMDASPDGFRKQAFNLGYHLQAAWYTDLWNLVGDSRIDRFVFIAYEKRARVVTVFPCTERFIEEGRNAYIAALAQVEDALATGIWPGYTEDEVELDLPVWVKGGSL